MSLSIGAGAWIGLAAGVASALADFGAHWLFMSSFGDRAWLGLRLLSLQASAGVLLGAMAGLCIAAAGSAAALLNARVLGKRVPPLQLQAAVLGLACSPAAVVVARLLWSGGMMSRISWKDVGLSITSPLLVLLAILAFWLGLVLSAYVRAAQARRAQQLIGACVALAFVVGKLNQWALPNLYDYLHAALSLATYALYALSAALLVLRAFDARAKPARKLPYATGFPLLALAVLTGYLSLHTLDQNQNVRVALLSANMPNSRSLLLGAAPLLPKVETQGADLAKQRAAAARARRAHPLHSEQDASLPQLADAHVLLITIDALRADHLSSYGYGRELGKELSALAKEGQLFEHAYAQAPHSSYSLCSLFTSEYLHETTELGTPPPQQTLPRILSADGYHTAAFYTQGIFHTAAERLGVYEDDAFGFALHDHQDRPPEQMTDRALEEIDRTLQRGEPSALFWVHYFNVHEPYRATTFGTSDVDRYDSEILAADAAIGRLVRTARERLTKPLVVVITADHGEEFHEHGGVYHGSSLYEEQVHVPLLILVPGQPARRYAQPVESIDIAPTLLGLLGVDVPASMRGSDLRRLIAHPELERGPVFSAVIHKKMVVSWPYKLIADLRFGAYELYDLSKDPSERQNNADRDPTRLRDMRAEIYAWLDTLSAKPEAVDHGTPGAQALEWGRLGDRRAVAPLQKLLLDTTAAAVARSEAARLLGKLADNDAAHSLLTATKTRDAWVAAEAAIALGRMFDDRAKPALRRLVASEDPGIRSRAAVSLARLRDKAAVPALVDALWLAPNPYEREEAVRWLGRLGDASALDPLLNLLPETHTRHLVVLALGELGDARAFEPLLQTLAWDHNTNVRDGVVRALATLGDARALEVLLPLVEDDSALRNTGEALIRLNALGRGLVGGTDIERHMAQASSGLGSCRQGPLRHDWDFQQRTYCRTTRQHVAFDIQIPRAVADAAEGSTLLVSLRRTDASAATGVELQLAEHLLQLRADGAWSEQRFSLGAGSLPAGTIRTQLLLQPGVRIELDHLLIVPREHATSLAAQQGG